MLKMVLDSKKRLLGIKFVTGNDEHVCRLCLSSTEVKETLIDESIRLQTEYFDGFVTYNEILQNFNVMTEPLLPQVLCVNCTNLAVNSFLFKKFCEYSRGNWDEVLNRLKDGLSQSDSIGNNVKIVYLVMNEKKNLMVTSRKALGGNKKLALAKVKNIIKSRSHYMKAKQKTLECEECGTKYNSKFLLMKHMKVHNKMKNLKMCPQCDKVFLTTVQLEDHAERMHYPKKIQCPKCPKKFSTQRLLINHNKLHHVSANCKLCCEQFPSRKDLKAHLDKHSVIKCPRCKKCLKNKNSFRIHMKMCGNSSKREVKFFCDLCNKGYVRKNGIRSHLKIDHGFGKVLSCDWCNKKFDAISRLRNHIVKHTRERNFHCDQCSGKFVTQAALVYHTRLHTGEKPFQCDLCEESFLSASRRMEHKRRKHLGPTKECHMCHIKFITSHQLKKHIQRHFNPHSKLYIPDLETKFIIDDLFETNNL